MQRTPIELRHLQTLLALRDTGSVSRAALWLHLTQSALSHQIKALEDFYGLPLFVRKSSPLLDAVRSSASLGKYRLPRSRNRR